MGGAVSNAPQPEVRGARVELVARLRRLEDELQQVQGRLLSLGGETLPGIYLVIEAAGRRALLPGTRVVEVVRIVAITPIPGAPPHVVGSFVWRGMPVITVDLRRMLGAGGEPDLDAQIIILAGTPAIGLLVDRVPRLVQDPKVYDGGAGAAADGLGDVRLAAGLCMEGDEVFPILDPSPIQAELAGKGA
jgi:purine-binding chemotaxis protein CheW